MRSKEYDYFKFFCDMMDCSCRCADRLVEILQTYEYGKLDLYTRELHVIENEADSKKHEMTERLMTEFLPPLELDDIASIARLLDTVCDGIDEVAMELYINDVHTIRPDAVGLAQVISKMCGLMLACGQKFRNFKKDSSIRQQLVAINAAEEDGDKLYQQAMRKLMTDGSGFRELVIWREVYGTLEDCCDAIEHVADALEEVILKNT